MIGKKLYQIHCEQCHMEDGRGVKIPPENQFTGYIYPPLSGHDTFNDGAGMNRVLTAAQFIKETCRSVQNMMFLWFPMKKLIILPLTSIPLKGHQRQTRKLISR